LRLVLLNQLHLCHQTSDAVLELAVLGGVDERVDTAVGEHQYHGEVVEPDDDQKEKFSPSVSDGRKSSLNGIESLTK